MSNCLSCSSLPGLLRQRLDVRDECADLLVAALEAACHPTARPRTLVVVSQRAWRREQRAAAGVALLDLLRLRSGGRCVACSRRVSYSFS